MNSEKQFIHKQIMLEVFEKCWKDNIFKKKLISEPIITLEKFIGNSLNIPSNKKVIVEDQTDNDIIYLNIIAEPNLDELELSKEQLELVAGGVTPAIASYFLVLAAGVAVGSYLFGD